MEYNDQKKIKEAKRLAAGDLGKELSKFPMRFAKAALIGDRPARNLFTKINNATVTLVNLGNGPILITCYHVLDFYRKLINECGSALFQIGDVELDPLSQLVAENEKLDLATIKLTSVQAKAISQGGEIGSCFFEPSFWPPQPIKEGDFVAFGGFPGQWRKRWAFDEVVFPSFSSGGCRVTQTSGNRFACQFERKYWVTAFNMENREPLYELGGMSGGPAFIHKGLYWEFIGVIFGFLDFDIMYLRPAHLICQDGSICDPLP